MATSNRDLSTLKNRTFDVVIVGGGISGAWLALHCSHLGYQTALIEQSDYASQTSSSSSKLLHSGIRYLQQMQFGKVRESALERAQYLYAAPHLSKPVPFAVPTFSDFARGKFFLNCGMMCYRALSLGENRIIDCKEQQLPPTRSISAKQLKEVCDISEDSNTGAVVFYERMVLAVLQSARKLGAEIFNYVEASHLLRQDNRVIGVGAIDKLTHETFDINSRIVVNSAGPWIDKLNSTLDNTATKSTIDGFAVGSHIICRQLSDHAIAITTQHQSDAKIDRGGRHVFIIPWRGLSLIGTSYNEVSSAKLDSKIKPEHVEQLVESINRAIPDAKLTRTDLIAGYSGLYPLVTDNIQNSIYQGSGEYRIIDHSKSNKIDGLVTALGAKFTTARRLSELTVKLVGTKLSGQSKIGKIKLHSGNYKSLGSFRNEKIEQYQHRLSDNLINHIIDTYGSDIDEFIATLDDESLQPICDGQPDILGQVPWAIKREQALQLKDVVFRRTSIGLLGVNQQQLQRIANLMARELGWSDAERTQQLSQVTTQIQQVNVALSAADNVN